MSISFELRYDNVELFTYCNISFTIKVHKKVENNKEFSIQNELQETKTVLHSQNEWLRQLTKKLRELRPSECSRSNDRENRVEYHGFS